MKQLLVSLVAASVALVTVQAVPASPAHAAPAPVRVAAGGAVERAAVLGAVPLAAGERGKRRQGRKVEPYYARPGVTFNDPYSAPYAWRKKLIPAIRRTHAREIIRVMTWSFFDSYITDTLIAAYRRGVVVRLIMSRSLSEQAEAGHNFRRLRRALRQPARPAIRRPASWARTCSNSCRGRGGSMHFKWISFSRTGQSRHVVMQGSANLNIRASEDQWNDWYTFVGNRRVYRGFARVFAESVRDRKAAPFTVRMPGKEVWFAPRHDDPVMRLLNGVRCKGAGPVGNAGRTVIRVAAAVVTSRRGERIAQKLNQLDRAGCDIRVVYTLAPRPVRAKWPGVATRQLAFDHNGDGLYDDYLHMKGMSIQGWVFKDRNNSFAYNGSANWSGLGQISDEQGMIMRNPRLARTYHRWIDRLFDKGYSPAYKTGTSMRRAVTPDGRVVDPYANIIDELR